MNDGPIDLDAVLRKARHAKPVTVLPNGYPLTEEGIARAFVDIYQPKLRFCHSRKCWFEWNGNVWQQQKTPLAYHWARTLCREQLQAASASADDTKKFSRAAVAGAIEKFASTDPAVSATSDTWDQNKWLLGTPGGTVNLRDGKLLLSNPANFITKMAGVTPDVVMNCPKWVNFMRDFTGGSEDMQRFLQQFCGYALTGETREHALLFLWGHGGNGKSVFLNMIGHAMKDYQVTADMELLTIQKLFVSRLAAAQGTRRATRGSERHG